MKKFTESGLEKKMLEWLEEEGWETYGEPEEDKRGSSILDQRYDREKADVIYWDLLKEKIKELNSEVDEGEAGEIIRKLRRKIKSESLIEGNKRFYKILRRGVKHTITEEDESKTVYIDLIDNENKEKNTFQAVTQFEVIRKEKIRPDITLFINGIPIIQIELKSTAEGTTVEAAIKEIKEYEEEEPLLFIPGLMNVTCDGEKFRCAAVGAKKKFYFPWHSENFDPEEHYEPKDSTKSLLNPETILDIQEYFVFYEGNQQKITPRYMQYRATNKIINRIKKGEPRKGLIWHTQGSGKTFTMLFTAYKAKKSPEIEDMQYLIVVDRQKLNEQLEGILEDIEFPSYKVAKSINHLEETLSENKSQLILTTIQKFQDVENEVNAQVDMDTVVMIDEAHRGVEAKLGSKLKAAIPEMFYFGFTGTPVKDGSSATDRNTFEEFSPSPEKYPEAEDYLDKYSIKDGQEDEVITEVTFVVPEKIEWEIPEDLIDREFEGEFRNLPNEKRQEIIRKYINKTALSEIKPRVEKITKDIQEHFKEKIEPTGFKAMVVTPSRKAAALYGEELIKYRDPKEVKVIVSPSMNKEGGEDPEIIQRHYLPPHEERKAIKGFKEKENPKILVVCDKLLTGFDAPILKTIYLDKWMNSHKLLQAIARVNRPEEDKGNGEIVDYQGIFRNIEETLGYENEIIIERAVIPEEKYVKRFKKKLDELMEIFSDIEFEGDPKEFQECIVRLEKNKNKRIKFENTYKEAQELYESLQPHKELGKSEIDRKWSILTQIYSRYKKTEKGEEIDQTNLGDEVREKTRKILEKHLEVEEIGEKKKITYEIPERETKTEELEQEEPEYGFIKRAINQRESLEEKRDENKAYQKLSDRVKSLIQKWENEEINIEQGREKLSEIKETKEEIEEEKKELGLEETGYSVYKLLLEDYKDKIEEDKAIELSRSAEKRVKDLEIKGNPRQIRKDIKRELIRAFVDQEEKELCKGKNKKILGEATDYIIENRIKNA